VSPEKFDMRDEVELEAEMIAVREELRSAVSQPKLMPVVFQPQ
jgi:hypothetical protein